MSKQSQSSALADRPFTARPRAFDRQGIEHGSSIERQLTGSFEPLTFFPQGSVALSTGFFGGDYVSYTAEPTSPASGSWVDWAPFSAKFELGTPPLAFSGFRPGMSLGSLEKPSLSLSVQEVVFESAGSLSSKLASRLQELSTLKDGWDGESARAVRLEAMLSTVDLLWGLWRSAEFRLPFIAPTHDGYLLLDWTSPERTLEAEAGPDGWSMVGTLKTPAGPNEYFDASIGPDWTGVHRYYLWFSGETQVWPTD